MAAPAASRHALAFIFVTVLIDVIGLGIIIPVMPKLINELTGDGVSAAASYGGWLSLVYALMQFLCAPLMGNLSDRFGRRPVLIIALLVMTIDYLIVALAPTIAFLFVGRFLAGISGASYSPAGAYIADVSPPEKRAQNFGLIGVAFGLGFIIGPAIGGLLGEIGSRLPFFAAAGLSFLNALYGLVVLKESLPLDRRRKFELARANPVGTLHALARRPILLGFIPVVMLMRLAHDSNPAVWTYYTTLKFHWSTAKISYSLVFVGITSAIVSGYLTRVLVPRIGEARAAYLGFAASALGFAGYAFATQSWQIYLCIVPVSLMGLIMPSLNAIMSRQVAPTEQGELQGALASLGGLTAIMAPPLMANLFAFFTSSRAPFYFPGAAFFAAALFMAVAAALLARTKPARYAIANPPAVAERVSG